MPSRKPLPRVRQKSIGAVIVNPQHEVLIMYSAKNKYWEFPKGKVERGERELDTLKREIWEETGIHRFQLQPDFREYIYYTFRVKHKIIRKVVIYYLFMTSATVHLSKEHSAYRWVDVNSASKYLKHLNQRTLLHRVNLYLHEHPL